MNENKLENVNESEKLKEGWGVFTGKVCHYYQNTYSLCGKRGFYTGPLEAETEQMEGECAQCRKKLDREKKIVLKGNN